MFVRQRRGGLCVDSTELIEEALVSNSSHSPLCAITRSLLKGIFHLQDAEEECKPAVLNTFPQDQSTTSKVEDANVDVKESVTDAEESQRVDEGPTDLPVEMPEVDQISQHDGPTDASADQLQGMEVSDPVTTQGLQQREVGCDQGLGRSGFYLCFNCSRCTVNRWRDVMIVMMNAWFVRRTFKIVPL